MTDRPTLTIGELASGTGTSPRTLRYYEQQGLLAPERTTGGHRRYAADAVERVRLYRRLLDAGLGTDIIRGLLPCMQQGSPSPETVSLLGRELDRIRAQASRLQETAARLERIMSDL